MIETLLNKIITELGATGLLVVGLYFILNKPLASMAKHIEIINHEIGEIIVLLKRINTEKNG